MWEYHVETDGYTWSDGVYQIFHLDPSHGPIPPRDCIPMVHPDDRHEFLRSWSRAVKQLQPLNLTCRVTIEGRGERYLRMIGQIIPFGPQGPRLVGSTSDVTEEILSQRRKLGERDEEISRTRRFIDAVAASIPDILFLYDRVEERNVYVNGNIERVLGYSPAEIHAMGALFLPSLMHPGDRERYLAYRERSSRMAMGEMTEIDYRARHKSGRWVWLFVRSIPFQRDANGIVTQVLGVASDVTERRHALETLEHAQEMAHVGSWEADLATRAITWSPEMYRIHGLEPNSEPATLDLGIEFAHPEDRPMLWEKIRGVEEKYQSYDLEYRIVLRDGQTRHVCITCRPVPEEGRVVGTLMDVTELRTSERDLRVARDAALASSTAKARFLANMSHEIRTPLNGVIGMASLLQQRDLDPEITMIANTIRSSGETLLRVIDDILDYSKIEAGRMDIEAVTTDLPALVADVVTLYHANAIGKGLWLRAGITIDRIPKVLADPVRLKQVLTNLVSNAVKFTQKGGVTLSLDVESVTADKVSVLFMVSDTGIGITQDQQEGIFERFTQAESSTHRRFGGTGLGLSISRRLVELMNGSLTLWSEFGRGSVFRVELTFPISTQEPVIESTDRLVPLGTRVLLAEDNAVNRMVAQAVLSNLGCEIETANDGLGAIHLATTRTFDIILMDIHMPVCDGLEATQAIRQHEDLTKRHTPILALSASAMNEDRAACLAAGMDGFLSKPITMMEIARAVATWVPTPAET